MKLRFPLYAKILLWFFLNLLLLAAAALPLFRGQFHHGFDWMLAMGAEERLQSVADLVLSDMRERPRAEWNSVLNRFESAYQVQFLAYRLDGGQIAGTPTELPEPVLARLKETRPPGNRQRAGLAGTGRVRPDGAQPDGPLPEGPLPDGPGPGRPPLLDEGPREGRRPGEGIRGPFPKFIVRTSSPTRYWVVIRAPITDSQQSRPGPGLLVMVAHSMSGGGLFFDFKPWLFGVLGAALFSALLWAPLVRGITRSIGQMTEATRQIAEGRFDARTDESRRDELGSLGHSINQMALRLAGFVSGQKRFLGDVAHELCSPLARIQLAIGILEQRADEKQRAYVDDLREEVQHMSGLVNELLSFSKASLGAGTTKLQAVPVAELVEKAIARESTGATGISHDVPANLRMLAEPELVVRALSNLLRNAVRYAGDAGPITVSAVREGGEVTITVSDRGPGVPEPELAQIFDPFYRLDTSRNASTGGVGLGLAIVKTCVESCQGSVSCRNRKPTGLQVELRFAAA
jgi:two-component system sensor histidine kinase CpxA